MIKFDQCLNQDMIHTATIPWLINGTVQGAILLAIDVNTDTNNQQINTNTQGMIYTLKFLRNQITDTSNQLINCLLRTQSTWLQSLD